MRPRKTDLRGNRGRCQLPSGVEILFYLVLCLVLAGHVWADSGVINQAFPWLGQHGVSLTLQETDEIFGNVSGGVKQGGAFDGLTQADLQMRSSVFGLPGGLLNVSGLEIHGNNLSAQNLFVLQSVSNIEATDGLGLWELWYDQTWGDVASGPRFDIKLGFQSLDQEFAINSTAAVFTNAGFGWPALFSSDLPGGGPAYPLSALGIRFRVRPSDQISILAGVFDGHSSFALAPFNDGVLAITEIQVHFLRDQPWGGSFKLGAWYQTSNFSDVRFDTQGLSLANPASNGQPRQDAGNFAVYGLLDDVLWTNPQDSHQTLGLFLRGMGAPSDRNTVDFDGEAGLVLKDPFFTESSDSLGLGWSYANMSTAASGLASDLALYQGAYNPQPSGESILEATYLGQVLPWLQVQPDAQYVFNPGGGVVNPLSPQERLGNEWVFGLRVTAQL